MFFPENTSSVLQPIDQSVIMCLKDYYRKRKLKVIEKVDSQHKQVNFSVPIATSMAKCNSANNKNFFGNTGHVLGPETHDPSDAEDTLSLSE